jgi:hypothetical protein
MYYFTFFILFFFLSFSFSFSPISHADPDVVVHAKLDIAKQDDVFLGIPMKNYIGNVKRNSICDNCTRFLVFAPNNRRKITGGV